MFFCCNLGAPQSNNNPKIHSFRVVTAQEASINDHDVISTTGISTSPLKSPTKVLQTNNNSSNNLTKIHKPILMCFICKLSFGNTKSFTLHANTEHQLNLLEPEKLLLSREYSSAIIQRNDDEKPQISFLEPLEPQQSLAAVSVKQQQELQQKLINDFVQQIQKSQQAAAAASASNNNDQQINDQATAMLLNNSSSSSSLIKSPNHHHNSSSSPNTSSSSSSASSNPIKLLTNSGTDNSSSGNSNNNLNNISSSSLINQQLSSQNQQVSSPPSSSSSSSVAAAQQQLLAAASISTNAAAAAKLLTELLHQQQQQFQQSLQCSEHQGQRGVDCKNCEMLNISLRSPLTPSKSPSSSSIGGDMNLISPTTSTPLPQSSAGGSSGHLNLSPGIPSITIGACPEHINGRSIGIECAR